MDGVKTLMKGTDSHGELYTIYPVTYADIVLFTKNKNMKQIIEDIQYKQKVENENMRQEIKKKTISTESATEGSFLRFKDGGIVWEEIKNARDISF